MRSAVVIIWMLLGACAPTAAQVSIGTNFPVYPDLVPVPGYPVYYAPQLDSNFFFYDGLYWVYAEDTGTPQFLVESQPSHSRQQPDRPRANAPGPEPKRDPEHDRDH